MHIFFIQSKFKNIIFITLTIFITSFCYHFLLAKTIPVFNSLISQKTIILDPGHGTIDKGVIHKESGIAESPINFAVSLEIKKILEKQNYNVILTRSKDYVELRPNSKELQRRVDLAKKYDADIYISIHVNQFPDPKYFGAQCFYHEKSIKGKILAQKIQKELKKLDPKNHRDILPQDLFVLRKSSVPAVLIEIGFISNDNDRVKLQNKKYQQKIAKAIATGINNYFSDDLP